MWVPWALWQAYGDLRVLRRSLRLDDRARSPRASRCCPPTGLWDTGFQFGDWLDPTAPPDQPGGQQGRQRRRRDRLLLSRRSILAETAGLLGRGEDARHFAASRRAHQTAFNEHYVHDDGTIRSDCADGICAGHRLRAARRR